MSFRKSREVWITLGAFVLILLAFSIILASEYAQLSNLQMENSSLSSEIGVYSLQSSFFLNATGQTSMNLTQSFASHFSKFESLNPGEALADYTLNATLTLAAPSLGAGPASGIETYTGIGAIEKPLGDLFGGTTNLGAANSLSPESWNFTITALNPTYLANGSAKIATNLAFSGQSRIDGDFNGTLVSKYLYVHQNGAWLIVYENWNFTSVYLQKPFHP